MREIGLRFAPDLAMIHINGHLQEDNLMRAVAALRTTRVLPMHHGAYGVLFFPQRHGPRDEEMLERWLGPLMVELELGESLPLDGIRSARSARWSGD